MATLIYKDHPRACGKHNSNMPEKVCLAGSPPRLRETPEAHGGPQNSHGITPAPAGNTGRMSAFGLSAQDHPRACGKHPSCKAAMSSRRGSPPRLRETLAEKNIDQTDWRITPAPAGNTFSPGYIAVDT